MSTIDEIEGLFDDHPSLDASLQDFEQESIEVEQSPRLELSRGKQRTSPSHHSAFRSEDSSSDSEMEEGRSAGEYSPPAWLRTKDGMRSSGFWRRPDNVLGGQSRSSRRSSPQYESAEEGEERVLAAAVRTRLPTGSLSPEKRRSPSPDPFPATDTDFAPTFGGRTEKPKQKSPTPKSPTPAPVPENTNNFIRFAVRAEVQHRTEPFEAAFAYAREKFNRITSSWMSLIGSMIIALLSVMAIKSLFSPMASLPVPDLVRVAGLAKAFEPLIYCSENGIQQIGDLQATGVAVWDLGESIRSTNMTSAPIIVKELDDLSENLKVLAIELTKFFANVDGDVDGILIVMDWAKRELSQLPSIPPSPLNSAFDNLHSLLSRIGVFETAGVPNRLGKLATDLFGQTSTQRTRGTLQRTFNEFLSVLEESISNELAYSTALFSLFESIDRQFLNLARAVIRESDQQERQESDLLASLWTRVLGSNSAHLRKFEKNRQLLSNVREKTVRNKHILIDHHGKLVTLKANLETLRRKLVSPLVRSDNSSTLTVEEQIRGLDGTYEHLAGVREKQKGKLMEMLYGAGSRRMGIARDGEGYEIDSGRYR